MRTASPTCMMMVALKEKKKGFIGFNKQSFIRKLINTFHTRIVQLCPIYFPIFMDFIRIISQKTSEIHHISCWIRC